MITIKRMSDIALKDASDAWNKGFEDYYVPMQMTIEQFTHRLGQDGLSPDHSFVAYVEGRPAGIILNGLKTFHDQKWAWNGGTSVAAPYRKQGVARKLMESAMGLYTKESVDTASLEAFSTNKKAIRLYESFGYKIVDRLLFLRSKKPDISYCENNRGWTIERGLALDVRRIPFYHYRVPWKTQWSLIQNGESLIAKDRLGIVSGFLLFKRNPDSNITLFQCVVDEQQSDKQGIMNFMLHHFFTSHKRSSISTYNLPSKNKLLISTLKGANFEYVFTENGIMLEQVLMIRNMEK